ncbi:MAG: cytochrome P450 [Rhodobacter sp.]|uniref:cytochrome P450 n=1 Tax=Pararhodobacter sp. TaxID=2127056 RepID=UPI001D571470|nr:cytochrome P450 [Pararhodobacter sp.]MCB1344693.1 cytochrome P450 [Paracoccaceae bacterium]MCC0074355.1 cytochrome P450 [Rhodobacter sp.]HPD91268.1 cytochrome P450 [Pararhodobacter sp.]
MAADDGLRPMIPHDWDPTGPASLADPQAELARLRRDCPVAGSHNWGGFYTLTRHDDVIAASKDPERFTATVQTVIPASPRKGLPRLPLQKDPPESMRYRKGLNQFFKENRIRAIEAPMRALAEGLARDLAAAATPEFGTGFAAPFTVGSLCILAGMDLSEADELGRLGHDYVAAVQGGDMATAGAISRAIDGFALRLVADRQAAPRDPETDIVSGLMAFDPDGGPYTTEELAGMVRLMLIGGHVVPRNFLCSMAWHLAGDGALQARLRADRLDRRLLIEEMLRCYSPNQALVRVATRDTRIGGTLIPQGCPVALNFLSANRDETVFDDPMRFDETRNPNRHIAFGIGPHMCLGLSVAKLQARITLDVLAALPPFTIGARVQWARWTEYGVTRLELTFA